MRIAVNTRFFLKDKLEGIGWFTYEICKRLVEEHPTDEFLFFFDRPFHPDFVFAENVKPLVLSPPARHPVLFYAWFEYAVARALEKYQVDIFLSPDNFCSLRATIPTVLVIHDLAYAHFPEQIRTQDRWYYRYFMPRFIKKAQQIVTVSNYTKQDIIEQHLIVPESIQVACNGCRPEFQPIKAQEQQQIKNQYADGQDYFFYIGAVHPRKNIHRLITAFDDFKKNSNSPMKLLIAGRFSWQAGEVKKAYEVAKFKSDIHFLGYVEDELLPKLMGSAFALTYVSTFEGFGVPLLEAMHCEIPIITSNVSSMPEVAGDAALLVDPHQVKSISEAMQQLYNNTDLRKKLVEIGKEQRRKFTWNKAAAVVYEACEKSLGQ